MQRGVPAPSCWPSRSQGTLQLHAANTSATLSQWNLFFYKEACQLDPPLKARNFHAPGGGTWADVCEVHRHAVLHRRTILWSSQKLNADTERNDKNLRSTCLSYKRTKNEKSRERYSDGLWPSTLFWNYWATNKCPCTRKTVVICFSARSSFGLLWTR